MLAKKSKLPGYLYPELLSAKTAVAGPLITLKLKKSDQLSRIGLLVGSKIANKAVIRNQVKRRIYEAVCRILPQLKAGHDILILPRPSLSRQSFSQIQSAVKEVFIKAKLLDEKTSS